jgi:microcystin-dependent protein
MVYPVGSYYISHTSTSPASLFGGTWHRIESRFLWAAPATSTLGLTAGEQTHTLTVEEMPSHTHDMYWRNKYVITGSGNGVTNATGGATTDGSGYVYMDATGGSKPHNNMPPYVNVAIWRRTA